MHAHFFTNNFENSLQLHAQVITEKLDFLWSLSLSLKIKMINYIIPYIKMRKTLSNNEQTNKNNKLQTIIYIVS